MCSHKKTLFTGHACDVYPTSLRTMGIFIFHICTIVSPTEWKDGAVRIVSADWNFLILLKLSERETVGSLEICL